MELTTQEKGWISLIRYNQTVAKNEVKKKISIGRFSVVYHWRSPKNLWGRFGGGWNWELGVQIGGRTWIVNCLVFSLRFELAKKL